MNQVSIGVRVGKDFHSVLVIELYDTDAARRFAQYCNNDFIGTHLHHVIRNYVAQGGLITDELSSVPFDPPNEYKHEFGTLSTVPCGDGNCHATMFFINLADNSDTFTHPVFGRVIDGFTALQKINDMGEEVDVALVDHSTLSDSQKT